MNVCGVYVHYCSFWELFLDLPCPQDYRYEQKLGPQSH